MDYEGEDFECDTPVQEYNSDVSMRGAVTDNSYSLGSPALMKSMELPLTIGFNVADFSISGMPGAVPEAPMWWDPYNHWIASAEDVLQQCAQAMVDAQATKVDFMPKYDQYMIKGIAYGVGQASATFHIRQFQAPDNQPGYLLEVSRQSGDSLTFSQFFQELKGKVDKTPSAPLETGGFFDLSQFDMDLLPLDDIPIDAESVQSIMILASSPMIDQTREGMSILAGLAEQEINHHEVIASEFFATVMTSALRSMDSECNRSGSLTLLRLLNSSTTKSASFYQTIDTLVPGLIEILQRPEQLEALQVNRHVVDCLNSLQKVNSSVASRLAHRTPAHLTDPHVVQVVSDIVASA